VEAAGWRPLADQLPDQVVEANFLGSPDEPGEDAAAVFLVKVEATNADRSARDECDASVRASKPALKLGLLGEPLLVGFPSNERDLVPGLDRDGGNALFA
jgi:hypothetical protein